MARYVEVSGKSKEKYPQVMEGILERVDIALLLDAVQKTRNTPLFFEKI